MGSTPRQGFVLNDAAGEAKERWAGAFSEQRLRLRKRQLRPLTCRTRSGDGASTDIHAPEPEVPDIKRGQLAVEENVGRWGIPGRGPCERAPRGHGSGTAPRPVGEAARMLCRMRRYLGSHRTEDHRCRLLRRGHERNRHSRPRSRRLHVAERSRLRCPLAGRIRKDAVQVLYAPLCQGGRRKTGVVLVIGALRLPPFRLPVPPPPLPA